MKSPFKTLIIREIQGAIIGFRFWVVLVLCLSIIPLSFYVSVKNYSQRLSDYQQEVQAYKDKTEMVSYDMTAEGVHPPSPLSIFSQGLGSHKMPYKVFTSRNGNYSIEYAKPGNKKDLLGEIDFAFIVTFVLSVLAIVFTFSAISGEKESGVLRSILANVVSRRQVLMAKLFGNYVVFLVPFLFSMLIALIVVYFTGVVPIFSKELFPAVLVMTGLSLLFLFAMFNFGLWFSAFAQSSILSINVLLLLWIVLGLVIPKISPIIGAAIYPVESPGVFESKKIFLLSDIEKEQIKEEAKFLEQVLAQISPQTKLGNLSIRNMNDPNQQRILRAYDEQVKPLKEKYEQRIIMETEQLTNDYMMRCNKQNNIARRISMLSPVNLINNLLAELSGSGNSERDNFLQSAKQFQATVKQEIYDKWEDKRYRFGTMIVPSDYDFNSRNAPIPVLDNYRHISTAQVFQENWVDFALLGFYCLLFFLCSFVSFLRFDVR